MVSERTSPARQPGRRFVLPGTVVVCGLWLWLWQRVWSLGVVDDGYIFLRYARNWAGGLGPVFNAGERVEGFSSPLWTALMVPGGLLFDDATGYAMAGGMLSACLMVGVFVAALQREMRSWRWALLAGLVFASCPGLVYWSCSGMETAFFCLLLFAALLAVQRDLTQAKIRTTTAELLALLCLTRMEGLLLLGLVVLLGFRQRCSPRWLVIPTSVIGAGLIARRLFFGDWLPNTFYAKATGNGWQNLVGGLGYVCDAGLVYSPLLVTLLVLAGVFLRQKRRDASWLLPWTLFSCAWVLYLVTVGGDHFAMHRFWQPLIPCMVYLAFALAARLEKTPLRWLVVLACLSSFGWQAVDEGPRALVEVQDTRLWRTFGEWLGRSLPPDALVATTPIGAIGYHSRLPILDLVGLTNIEIGRHGDVDPTQLPGHRRFNSSHVLRRSPLVVYLNMGGPRIGDLILVNGYNKALLDLFEREETMARYRLQVHECGPGLYVHLLVRRDILGLPNLIDAER